MKTYIFALSLLAGTVGYAQSTNATAGFSPVPVLPQGASVPADSTQYVYLGPSIQQITLSFPSRLGEGDALSPRVTYAVKRVNQVAPVVANSVTKSANGVYSYSYVLQNAGTAQDGISVWAVGLPAANASLSATHPTWSSSVITQPNTPQSAFSQTAPVAFVTWKSPTATGLGPNGVSGGYTVTSAYAPGFTIAYARSADTLSVPADLPKEVVAQLSPLYAPEWLNQSLVVIGPRYPAGWSKQVVAADYLYGINKLVRQQVLAADSKFVTGAQSSLTTFLGAQGGATLPDAGFLSLASGSLETSIANAIGLSLQQ